MAADTMLKMWSGNIFDKQSKLPGDFAAGVIISHEFGHHIADELAKDTGWNRPTGKYIELVADCFAGIWAANVWYEGYLDAGDQDEAIAALESIGDPPGFRGTGAHGRRTVEGVRGRLHRRASRNRRARQQHPRLRARHAPGLHRLVLAVRPERPPLRRDRRGRR